MPFNSKSFNLPLMCGRKVQMVLVHKKAIDAGDFDIVSRAIINNRNIPNIFLSAF